MYWFKFKFVGFFLERHRNFWWCWWKTVTYYSLQIETPKPYTISKHTLLIQLNNHINRNGDITQFSAIFCYLTYWKLINMLGVGHYIAYILYIMFGIVMLSTPYSRHPPYIAQLYKYNIVWCGIYYVEPFHL